MLNIFDTLKLSNNLLFWAQQHAVKKLRPHHSLHYAPDAVMALKRFVDLLVSLFVVVVSVVLCPLSAPATTDVTYEEKQYLIPFFDPPAHCHN